MVTDTDLKNHIVEKATAIMLSWTDGDIYAISFYVENLDENPYMPTVSFGYNTEREHQKAIVDTCDEAEVRWNFAFWQQNQSFIFGEDDETKDLVESWIITHGFPYCEDYSFNEESDDDCSAHFDLIDNIMDNYFVPVLIKAVKELHHSSIIKDKFSREIPILIHGLEYCDKIAKQNVGANPLALVEDFVSWIYTM